uniref:Uncharacterized protein n=1 Tax=Romanomermis culicivorax TaxID=13658 RepID=A0A915KW31_ROMCU
MLCIILEARAMPTNRRNEYTTVIYYTGYEEWFEGYIERIDRSLDQAILMETCLMWEIQGKQKRKQRKSVSKEHSWSGRALSTLSMVFGFQKLKNRKSFGFLQTLKSWVEVTMSTSEV